MDFNNTWEALLNPGEEISYFDIENPPNFEVNAPGFSMVNAWWLSEFSRLIYRQERDELADAGRWPRRKHILERISFREVSFIKTGEVRCAVIESFNVDNDKFGILVFRGTTEVWDLLVELNSIPGEWSGEGLIHKDFMDAFDRVWDTVEETISAMDMPFFYTGHNLGAALAILAASKKPPQAVYTFGSPRVGDEKFAASLKDIRLYRVVNNLDRVNDLPAREKPFNYRHAGDLYYINQENRVIVNPDYDVIAKDRQNGDFSLRSPTGYRRKYDPPQYLGDHAAVNYVAQCERLLLNKDTAAE